mmetsp:Transcript_21221/g.23777  ORF Transcript_21221/g.23777 Transcript_21221/m.23777 type:complete len:283 (-) Transcript_21221:321-1169(-)
MLYRKGSHRFSSHTSKKEERRHHRVHKNLPVVRQGCGVHRFAHGVTDFVTETTTATFATFTSLATVPDLEFTAISVVTKPSIITIETAIIVATKATAVISSLASFASFATVVTAAATDPFTDFVAILWGVATIVVVTPFGRITLGGFIDRQRIIFVVVLGGLVLGLVDGHRIVFVIGRNVARVVPCGEIITATATADEPTVVSSLATFATLATVSTDRSGFVTDFVTEGFNIVLRRLIIAMGRPGMTATLTSHTVTIIKGKVSFLSFIIRDITAIIVFMIRA